MKFIVGDSESLNVSDSEILDLLYQVYVQAGFTSEKRAETIFDPARVRDRGVLIASRETTNNESSGFVAVGEMTKSGIKFLVYERTL
jgi:predicted transcriptional regulator with HTH domain